MVSTASVEPTVTNPVSVESTEYRLLVDKSGSDLGHSIACHHFAMDDFPALSAMAKTEMDSGFTVTIEIVASTDNAFDYDERTAGGFAGTTKGH